jgi:hypothetical protein
LRKEVNAWALVILVLVGLGAGYLLGVENPRTIVLTTTVIQTKIIQMQFTTFASPVSPSGLQLQIRVNTTEIREGRGLAASVVLVNTFPDNLSLIPRYSTNPTISSWDMIDFLCGNSPFWGRYGLEGFALFRGHISSANLSSSGSPLVLTPPVAIPCVSMGSPTKVVLLPSGTNAVLYYNTSNAPPERKQAVVNATTESCIGTRSGGTSCGSLNGALFGYWDPMISELNNPGDANTSSRYFHYFTSGEYTLVAEDLWNQTAFAYFQVLPKQT